MEYLYLWHHLVRDTIPILMILTYILMWVQYLFKRYGQLKKIDSGYYYSNYICAGKFKNNKDKTLNGEPFPKCIECIYIGEKDKDHKFKIEDLDNNFEYC